MTDGTEPEPRSDVGGASRDVPSDQVDGRPERVEAPAENVERVRMADDHGRRGAGRQAALLGVVFVATLILLLGATAVIRQGPAGSIGPSASAAAMAPGSVTPSPSPSGAGSASSPTATPSAGTAPGSPTAAVSSGPSAAPTVPTTTPLPSPATLVGAGDIGDCGSDGDSATAAIVAKIPGTVFTAGDNAYGSGSTADFRDCYDPTWGAFKDRTRPAAGNHDWATRGAAGYLAYFGSAATGSDGKTWYSYDLATWHIIVLDSDCSRVGGCGADSAQGRWLAADLAASDARCTMAIWHHPRFSSGFHGNDRAVGPFWTALYDAGVDVIVNGHDHDYERFAPQDPTGGEDRERGIREFVVGTGGTPLREFVQPYRANSELRSTVAFGVIEFTLRDGSYDWDYHVTKTEFEDRGQGPCH